MFPSTQCTFRNDLISHSVTVKILEFVFEILIPEKVLFEGQKFLYSRDLPLNWGRYATGLKRSGMRASLGRQCAICRGNKRRTSGLVNTASSRLVSLCTSCIENGYQ